MRFHESNFSLGSKVMGDLRVDTKKVGGYEQISSK